MGIAKYYYIKNYNGITMPGRVYCNLDIRPGEYQNLVIHQGEYAAWNLVIPPGRLVLEFDYSIGLKKMITGAVIYTKGTLTDVGSESL